MTHVLDPYSLVNTFIDNNSIHLVSVIGTGAYGVVYLGVHVPSSRRYAIKLITRRTSTDNEIQLHNRVSGHSGILKLEKVVHEERENRIYLVLEYAPGGDLFKAIKTRQQGIIGNDEAIRYIFLQLIDAVQYCHEQGVAHRDLKPENILVFPHLRVKLADFGLATTQLVSAGFGCGSSFYFSPECQGHTINKGYSTRQNDVWSLGVILVNMTTGRNPWRQASFLDPTFKRYMGKPHPSFFMATLPRISADFAMLLSRIFCLDPSRRISLPELRIRIKDMLFFKDMLIASQNIFTTM
ncbi:Pkinase-domain-containing protein [Lichtheimia hyalospora FSU 10163]|nr:Pkinase-domain-containing protein [Lichtheimia hyalospora FSU 10163]